jgi:hypothetical protein
MSYTLAFCAGDGNSTACRGPFGVVILMDENPPAPVTKLTPTPCSQSSTIALLFVVLPTATNAANSSSNLVLTVANEGGLSRFNPVCAEAFQQTLQKSSHTSPIRREKSM